MNAWIPLISTIAGGLVSAFTPQITDFISSHPTFAMLGATLIGAIAHFFPSPTAKS